VNSAPVNGIAGKQAAEIDIGPGAGEEGGRIFAAGP